LSVTRLGGWDLHDTGLVQEPEKAIIVAVSTPGRHDWTVEDRLDELESLLRTAGARVEERVVQNRESPDPAYLIGRGKVDEVEELRKPLGAGLVVFDAELSPGQRRNLERHIGCKVIDRTQVILDIFAQRARTREGKLQVELAQLTYSLTQLVGSRELSRLGGGIGTRGPGETKLEVDRRRIRQRIQGLKREIESVRRHRALSRREREKAPVAVAALAGYTNAGKSTLLNNLTGASVFVEDKLFATLDPTTRRMRLPSGQELLITDTVGFIRDLPHDLIAAFGATLEEITEADVIVHVVDGSHPAAQKQIETVERVLAGIGAGDVPVILAVNKIDLGVGVSLPGDRTRVMISALSGLGFADLLMAVDNELVGKRQVVTLVIPYSRQNLIAVMHEHGKVTSQDYGQDAITVTGEVESVWAKRLLRWADPAAAKSEDGGETTGGPKGD